MKKTLSDTLFGRINVRTVPILFKLKNTNSHLNSLKQEQKYAQEWLTRVADRSQLFDNDNVHNDD